MTEPADQTDAAPAGTIFQVKAYVDVETMTRDLSYSPTDLTSAMMDQASLFAHYGILAGKASRQVDVLKMLIETAEASLDGMLRNRALAAGEKVTEAGLEKRVARQPRMISLKTALIDAKQIDSLAKTALESFRQRRDMLVQLGATGREELKGELAIVGRAARAEAGDAIRAEALERLQRAKGGGQN